MMSCFRVRSQSKIAFASFLFRTLLIGSVVFVVAVFSRLSYVSQGASEENDHDVTFEDLKEAKTETNDEDIKGASEAFKSEGLSEILDDNSESLVNQTTTKSESEKSVEDRQNDKTDDKDRDKDEDKDYYEFPYYPGNLIVRYEGSDLGEFLAHVKDRTGFRDAKLSKLSGNIYLLESKSLENKSLNILESEEVSSTSIDYELAQILDKVESIPGVAYAEADYQLEVLQFTPPPNDPFYPNQWALAKIQAEAAWSVEQGSSDVIIAVIDTGVDLDHGDLNDNLWLNQGEIPNNGTDDDGNGFIDDVYGYNFAYDNNNPDDDNGHGTHCAGIAAAETNNGIGVAGICPNCRIMSVKSFNSWGMGWSSWSVAAIQYAIDSGADIVSNSWGGSAFTQSLQDVINDAYAQGIHIIAAVGNDNTSTPFYPAAMGNVIAVSATTRFDAKYFLSNFGSHIDVSAPGVDVLSTFPPGFDLGSGCGDSYFGTPDDGYGICSGTSMAAPHVAGMLGLMKTHYPSASISELELRLYAATVDLGDPGWDQYFGWGRINAFFSVGDSDLSLSIADLPDPVFVGDNLTYTVSVINNGPVNAADVVLTQDLPGSVNFVSAVPQQGSCSESSGTVTCDLGISRVGGSPISVEVTVIPALGGPRRRVETTTASVSALTSDLNLTNNSASEDTTINDLSLLPPVMVYPQDGEVLGWGADQSYMFKVEPVGEAREYVFRFEQGGILILEETTDHVGGEFAIHPDHPNHGDFLEGYVDVSIRARLVDNELTEPREITIALADYWDLTPPTMVNPINGSTIRYDCLQYFTVEPVFGARYYLFGFFQNGQLVYEEMTTEPHLETYIGSPTYEEGNMQIWVRALKGPNWTRARKIYVTLDPDAPPPRP